MKTRATILAALVALTATNANAGDPTCGEYLTLKDEQRLLFGSGLLTGFIGGTAFGLGLDAENEAAALQEIEVIQPAFMHLADDVPRFIRALDESCRQNPSASAAQTFVGTLVAETGRAAVESAQ